jgi:hypothetical protein
LAAIEEPQAFAARTNGALMVKLVTGTAVTPAFCTVTCSELEVVPTSTSPKFTDAGDNITGGGFAPVPLKPTNISPPATLPPIVSWPVLDPAPVGVKVTCIVQLAPEPTVLVWQLSVSPKSPTAAIAVTARPIPPVFVTVMVCPLLATPNAWIGNVSEVGLASAVVNWMPAVQSGICQMPRPYVPATSTLSDAVDGAALS